MPTAQTSNHPYSFKLPFNFTVSFFIFESSPLSSTPIVEFRTTSAKNAECSDEDMFSIKWSFHLTSSVTEYQEFEEDGSSPSPKHLGLQNTESYEEDGAGPSTQHLE
ncbi:hypothetical protein LWI28_020674 [Acer negundo]|uniref:Uncharacterized protein n=1 Tax=Acer negundo TaxID=4023 RepID=A0AAD5NXX9_ACENE|nr:hypothetical protein LWI28_020674 [Acer negundo]